MQLTPNLKLKKWQGTDLVSAVFDAFNENADILETKVSTNTDNISLLQMSVPYTELATNGYYNKKVGYFIKNSLVTVILDYVQLNVTIPAWGTHTLATLPTGRRPVVAVISPLFVEGDSRAFLLAGMTGVIQIHNNTPNAIPVGKPFSGSVAFSV